MMRLLHWLNNIQTKKDFNGGAGKLAPFLFHATENLEEAYNENRIYRNGCNGLIHGTSFIECRLHSQCV